MKETIHRNIKPLTVLQRVETDNTARQCSLAQKSCILLVTKNSRLAIPVMDYAINVADRMKCKVLAIYVNTLPHFGDDGMHRGLFKSAIKQNAAEFKDKAAARGVEVEYVQDFGKISKVINSLCRMVKRVEFVLIDQGIKIEEAAFGSPVPVFNIVCTDARTGKRIDNRQEKTISYGEKHMKATSRKSHLLKTLIFGTMTAALYAAVFTNSEFVMRYFTRGGIYTLLPVATVFAFSYAHGSFTSNFWSALGIEGSKATVQKQAEKSKTVDKRRDTRPRVQANV